MHQVDLNCDMGESFGHYSLGSDVEMLDYITSANIACGFHAGDPSTMRSTVLHALRKGVGIGAHPGLPDLVGFGRRSMDITPTEAHDMVVYQIGALHAFVQAEGAKLLHVKPHGALYNMAAKNLGLAQAIAQAVYRVNPELILYGLAGSQLIVAGQQIGLRTASEVFADRTYQSDGSLTPRQHADALVQDEETAIMQVVKMVKAGTVTSQQGSAVAVSADTVCIHGDGAHALSFAKQLWTELPKHSISVLMSGCLR
jgi:5-oxoprolinase (ATP-hydrolysing) subunit A